VDRLESMTTFVRIVDAGSLSAAGRLLRLSLPAVSRQLAGLEARLGVELIRRTTRRIALTETGTIYYQACRRILAEVDEADDAASGLHGEPRGTLVVDAPGTFGHLYLAQLLPRFLARHPGLHLNLRLNDRLVDLVEERTDLLVRVGRVPDSTTLVARRLAEHPRGVCASPGYLARSKRPTRPDELAQHECILLSLLSTPDRWELRANGESVTVHVRGRVLINDGAACEGRHWRTEASSSLPVGSSPTTCDAVARGAPSGLDRSGRARSRSVCPAPVGFREGSRLGQRALPRLESTHRLVRLSPQERTSRKSWRRAPRPVPVRWRCVRRQRPA
jgi:DNA-binding transcriptional LysR family regulator